MTLRPRWKLLAPAWLALGACAATAAEPAKAPDPASVEFFEKKIRPILVSNCYTCHSADTNSKGGLRVDDRNGLVDGGNSGPAVLPGNPEESLLLQAVLHEDGAPKMPPKSKLTEQELADLTQWIKDGAAWPEVPVAAVSATISKPNEKYNELKKNHWAWQPLKPPAQAPAVVDGSWPVDTIDRFILARLEKDGLAPVGDADKATLLRRLSFDLGGLPPTPDELAAFVADASPNAYEKAVDRLLASPAFGERWGRHWLDVARYAESSGASRNLPFPHAWRYRDYVIDALNKDKPYDRFLREQVAGDLLPANNDAERSENLVATGFLALGVKDVNQRFKVRYVMDNIDEQIDTVTRAVLGVTASCARCHDHKFDPVPQKDYYALAGIFKSTDLCAGLRNKMGGGGLDYYDTAMLIVDQKGGVKVDTVALEKKVVEAKKAHAEAKKAFEILRDDPKGAEPGPDGRPKRQVARQKMNRAQAAIVALSDPVATGAKVIQGVRDAKAVGDTELRIRGEAEKLGPAVPRGFLTLLELPDQAPVNPAQSGRLELANWLASPANPLTSRVMANRVWQHLIGRGIVSSVDNFGVKGDVPTHPELLDHLADRFIQGKWSVKSLVRTVVLTRTYRLSAEASSTNEAIDPANRLVWRHAPRRLDAEEIRDATLAASGALAASRPDGSFGATFKVSELRNNGPEARKLQDQARGSLHRSVYLPLLRGLTPTSLDVFDFAEQGMVTGSRSTTTVAPQALYLLNDPFVRKNSVAFAETLLARADLDDDARIRDVYLKTLGRAPSAAESDRAKGYLAEFEQAAAAEPEPQPQPTPEVKPAKPVVVAKAEDAAGAKAKPTPIIDPDQLVPEEAPVVEEIIKAKSPKAAALASFCQALFGSAEFRYIK
ncbi:PSD1 and planctomycete cytochrome C domain-containing protein [Isosphaeraceae bacterium EP7]